MSYPVKTLCLLVLAASLSACGNSRSYSTIEPDSQPGRSRANLELPPDLQKTASDSLAVTSAEDLPEEEVLPEIEGLEVERNDREGWLEVEAVPNRVWRRLVSHWGALGVDLVVSDAKTGIMETDWVKPARAEREQDLKEDFLDRFLGRFIDETTSLDKYTMRLEKVGDTRTRIYVSHKGIKKIQTSESGVARNAEWEWVETDEDPDKVRRAISSIVYGLDSGGAS